MPLLDIRNLTIEFKTSEGWVKAVDRVSMTLSEGEIRGLVGESGSGKSLIAKAICGVAKDNWRVTADRMRFDDIDLLRLSSRERRKLVGHNVSMIFQEPQSCLDPSERVGRQLMQNIPAWTYKGRWWQRLGWRKRRAIELLHRVGIKDHKDAMRSFPYELTDGECQKVMIAIALANQPRLLIADEPTNSMEPTTQAQIFRLLTRLNQNSNTTILLISHDLQMLSQWADKINVLYCGQTVETAPSKDLVTMPHHPYTQALIRAIPDFGSAMPHKSRLNTLPGAIPLLEQLPIGCRLGPRCPYAQRECIITPRLTGAKNHLYACHFPLNMEESDMVETLLEVRNLSKTFRYRTGWFRRQTVDAVKPLSFTLRERQTLAIIGENGSGKSTLAKMLAGMIEPTSGELLIDDHPLHYGDYSFRSQRIRMIFQDPSTSLNPRQRISQILDFPLRLNTDLEPEQRRKQIVETMRMVGLLPDHVSYYPHMLAPGQKQRLGLARALILRPKVIIADEALASLDMSMRSQLINLMLELQEKQGISYIYVTQHIGMMKHISDQVLVMHQGEVVERGSTADVLASPLHELTRRLIAGHFGEALTADAWRKDR